MPYDCKLFVCPYFSFPNRVWSKNISSPTKKIRGQRSICLYLFPIRRSLIFLDLTFICTYIYIYIDMCVYTHTYIYIYLIHISMFIHTYIHVCVCSQSCLTLCDPIECSPLGSSVHEIFQAWNTGAGCHFHLQGIFPTQGLNPCLCICKQILYHCAIWEVHTHTYTHINRHLHKQTCILHRQLKSPRGECGGKWAEGAGRWDVVWMWVEKILKKWTNTHQEVKYDVWMHGETVCQGK